MSGINKVSASTFRDVQDKTSEASKSGIGKTSDNSKFAKKLHKAENSATLLGGKLKIKNSTDVTVAGKTYFPSDKSSGHKTSSPSGSGHSLVSVKSVSGSGSSISVGSFANFGLPTKEQSGISASASGSTKSYTRFKEAAKNTEGVKVSRDGKKVVISGVSGLHIGTQKNIKLSKKS